MLCKMLIEAKDKTRSVSVVRALGRVVSQRIHSFRLYLPSIHDQIWSSAIVHFGPPPPVICVTLVIIIAYWKRCSWVQWMFLKQEKHQEKLGVLFPPELLKNRFIPFVPSRLTHEHDLGALRCVCVCSSSDPVTLMAAVSPSFNATQRSPGTDGWQGGRSHMHTCTLCVYNSSETKEQGPAPETSFSTTFIHWYDLNHTFYIQSSLPLLKTAESRNKRWQTPSTPPDVVFLRTLPLHTYLYHSRFLIPASEEEQHIVVVYLYKTENV